MALPTTGVDWNKSGLTYDATRVRKSGLVAAIVRDYYSGQTIMAPESKGGFGSVFAQDGKLRNDLLLTATDDAGAAITPNLQFWKGGAFDPKGVDFDTNITTDETEILQSNEDILSEVTKKAGMIGFSCYESTPFVDALRLDQPLTDSSGAVMVPDIGLAGYMVGEDADADALIERQLVLIRAHKAGGRREFTAIGFPRVVLNKIGKTTWSKKNPDALDITFKRLLCPFAVDATGKPKTYFIWRDGEGWRAGGGNPVFGLVAPVASPTTSAHATLTFATPTGIDDPFTYAGEVSTDGGTTWVAGTLQGSPAVSGANTVLTFSGLTAGATKLRAKATGDNLATTTTAASNSITVT